MEQNIITLELLVRSGNSEGVKQFAISEGFEEVKKNEKIAEAGIYSAIKKMWEEAEGGIDSQTICIFLKQNIFTSYFSTVNNTEVLEKIVDVLQAGTRASMEAYAQITAIDILGIESFSNAIRRNIDAPHMREKVTQLVQSGYSLVFCPHDIDADMVDHYFPIINQWKEFVNPHEIARAAIIDITEDLSNEDILDHYGKDFLYKALDKLIELTDRESVSRLVYEHFGDSKNYNRLIEDEKVDAYNTTAKIAESSNIQLNKALQGYEKNRFPSKWDVTNLAKVVDDNDKELIARKMGEWFRLGKIEHLLLIAKYEDGKLYRHETARKTISEGIEEASNAGNFTLLESVLDLPPTLLDQANPAINGVIRAYNISLQTRYAE